MEQEHYPQLEITMSFCHYKGGRGLGGGPGVTSSV